MKNFLILLVVILMPSVTIYGQPMPVFDAFVASALEKSHLEQVLYYAQMVADNISMIENTVQQIEFMKQQSEIALRNLNSFGDIKDFDDFMSWYNRQLYLERRAGEVFDNINVKIGKKQYHVTDIKRMAYGAKDTYADYWDKEFTDCHC